MVGPCKIIDSCSSPSSRSLTWEIPQDSPLLFDVHAQQLRDTESKWYGKGRVSWAIKPGPLLLQISSLCYCFHRLVKDRLKTTCFLPPPPNRKVFQNRTLLKISKSSLRIFLVSLCSLVLVTTFSFSLITSSSSSDIYLTNMFIENKLSLLSGFLWLGWPTHNFSPNLDSLVWGTCI